MSYIKFNFTMHMECSENFQVLKKKTSSFTNRTHNISNKTFDNFKSQI